MTRDGNRQRQISTDRAVVAVKPLRLAFDAKLVMPGSKSHSNRALVAACLADGATTIFNATACDDVALMVGNLRRMGFSVDYSDRGKGTVSVRGGIPAPRRRMVELYCGNAGTTTRFLTALACVVPGAFRITGDADMSRRPIRELVVALGGLGADIADTDGCPPVLVGERTLFGRRTELCADQSSQYLTALLLVGPALARGLTVKIGGRVTSRPYVALTRKVMRDFGVRVRQRGELVSVASGAHYTSPGEYTVEGDQSAAGAFRVLAELTGSRVDFSNLARKTTQGDAELPRFIAALRTIGPVTIDCSGIPDQVMNLVVLAAFRKGKTRINGAANLRLKECDRLAVTVRELSRAGIKVREHRDGLVISGGTALRPTVLDPHNDHRLAFCFAVLGSLQDGFRIRNPGCVGKSYPGFFSDLSALHRSLRPVAIIGMRAAGKSTLGRRLAARLGLRHADTDREFERVHGSISEFVSARGWQRFRAREADTVRDSLRPGTVVSLGGGALGSPSVRRLLTDRATVVHLDVEAPEIIRRLRRKQRPALTDLPLEQEVRAVLLRREPLYRRAADITVGPDTDLEELAKMLRL